MKPFNLGIRKMYQRFKNLAAATGDPVRLTKVNAIDTVVTDKIAALSVGVIWPTYAEFIEAGERSELAINKSHKIVLRSMGRILNYGRARCQEMVNRLLPFVTGYNPNTDPDWPT